MLRLSIALLWIGTAIVSFGLFPVADSYVMLAEVGVRGPLADLALFGGAAVNLALGAMLLVNVRVAAVGMVMLALLIVYSLVGLALPTDYWLNPFAPILKNLPIAARSGRARRDGAPAPPTRALVLDLDLRFDLDGGVERQLGHADGGAARGRRFRGRRARG